MSNFSVKSRSRNIEVMKNETFDLVIIGGGITGAGIARDASSRGMKVALVEARDFASGTSSRSSKLIHGGIRYLENLEFHLVFEALSERSLLFEIAPHLVHPLRFVLPLYKGDRVGMFKMGLGMALYDALALFDAPESHERLDSKESIGRLPMLNKDGLKGSYVYSDAYMDDDRLVIETLRSAVGHGTITANYVSAYGAKFKNGQMCAIECINHQNNENFVIQGKHFISSVGPWTDQLGQNLLNHWKPLLRPSKGIHLTIAKDRLPLEDAVVMAADKQKRIVFGIPRHEMVILGTTDTDFKDDPALVKSTAEDVKYLLKVVNEYFPGANITPKDVIASYAGVRPLVHDGSSSESKTSREHLIFSDPRNVTFVTGGKYTIYRHMAEETVEKALNFFSIEEQIQFGINKTKSPINSKVTIDSLQMALDKVEEWSMEFQLPVATVKKYVERHGPEAKELIQYARGYKNFKSNHYWVGEAVFAIQNTMCVHLIDFYLRRTPLFLSEPDHGLSLISDLAQVFAHELSWDNAKIKEEIDMVQDHLNTELGWKTKLSSSSF